MNPKIFLRIASVVMFLHDVGHTFGQFSWKQSPDPAKQEVINKMIEHKSPFMGATRSMADYFDGYGFASTLALLLIAGILWVTSNYTTENSPLVRKILVLLSIILMAWGIDELIFFFPFAAGFSLLAMLLTVLSIFQLPKKTV